MNTTIKSVLALLFVLSNYKVLPFSWTFRFQIIVLRYIFIPLWTRGAISAPKKQLTRVKSTQNGLTSASGFDPSSSKLFATSTWTSSVNIFECDMNFHKSNSTYFSDLDIARSKLVISIFNDFFITHKRENGIFPYVPLGSVMCVFKREIKPLQSYHVRSRFLGWDDKWLFVLSRFEFNQGKETKLAAVCLSKYVFKEGRKTIAPEVVIKDSGFLNGTDEENNLILKKGRMDFELAKSFLDSEMVAECDM